LDAPSFAHTWLRIPEVHISEYQDALAITFDEERNLLSTAIGLAHEDLQHIGSTAVAVMIAKPIVDIMIGFIQFPPPPWIIQKLSECQYESFGEA
jgi:GrpB-like predicted nucleotidyltransferase (UPF0157 family)